MIARMNNTTRALLIALVSGLLVAVLLHAQAAHPSTSSSPAGKFQLVAGSFTAYNLKDGNHTTEPGMFKVDTSTGESWCYVTGVDAQGKLLNYWHKIDQE